jgi:hypothetical protein
MGREEACVLQAAACRAMRSLFIGETAVRVKDFLSRAGPAGRLRGSQRPQA